MVAAVAAGRLTNLDALRGVAVLLMIEQHVGIWLWRGPGPGQTRGHFPVLVAINAVGGFGAPLFFSLAGAGAALMVARGGEGLDRLLLRRGAVVMGLGYAMNLLSPSWFSWGSWFALHLMGLGIATGGLWRRLSDRGLLGVAAGLMLAAPIMQSVLQTSDDLYLSQLRDTSLPGGVLRLAFVEGQYPILPWLSIVVLGFVSGRWILAGQARRVAALGVVLVGIGAASYGAFVLLQPPRPEVLYFACRLKLGFFPPSVSMVCLVSGPAFVLAWAATRRGSLSSSHPMVTAGRASLTVFFLHVPLFRELSRPIGWWSALDAGPTLAVVFALCGASLWLSRLWQRVGYRYGAEWLVRRIAG